MLSHISYSDWPSIEIAITIMTISSIRLLLNLTTNKFETNINQGFGTARLTDTEMFGRKVLKTLENFKLQHWQ